MISPPQITAAISYSLCLDAEVVKVIVESVWNCARREHAKEIMTLIKREADQTNQTGHGKAQRFFAEKILRELESEKS